MLCSRWTAGRFCQGPLLELRCAQGGGTVKHGVNVPVFGEYADVRLLAKMAAEAEAVG